MWYQFNVAGLDEAQLEALSEALDDYSCLSVTLTDAVDSPIYEPELNTTPLWHQTILTALFNDENVMTAASQFVTRTYPQAKIKTEAFEDKDWQREALKDIKPMQFGNRLWICPSHCQPVESAAVNVLLDPGLAFGTGTHPTTAMCLRFLDSADLANKTICDYGTGSGILAISALKLDAQHAYAVDIDPQAIIATQQNAEENAIPASSLSLDLVDKLAIPQVDVMVANILAGPLVALAPKLLELTKPGGEIVLSGLLTSQLSDIQAAYQPHCQDFNYQTQEEWAMCHMIRT